MRQPRVLAAAATRAVSEGRAFWHQSPSSLLPRYTIHPLVAARGALGLVFSTVSVGLTFGLVSLTALNTATAQPVLQFVQQQPVGPWDDLFSSVERMRRGEPDDAAKHSDEPVATPPMDSAEPVATDADQSDAGRGASTQGQA